MNETLVSCELAETALRNLRSALLIKSPSELERDGTIQRFEYCYEIIWKLGSRVLKENAIRAEVPKSVFRELGRIGWINNVEEWIDFQKSRSDTSHEYGNKFAERSYLLAQRFLPLAESLLRVLSEKSKL